MGSKASAAGAGHFGLHERPLQIRRGAAGRRAHPRLGGRFRRRRPQIDLLLFGTNAYPLPAVTLDEIEGYVERVILARYKIREATNYAPPLRMLLKKYRAPQPAPAFVIFITDGGNADRSATTEVIRELSGEPVFVQFVGIGKEDFPFLHKLDELSGRLIDNAGFMHVNDLDAIKDAELYDRLLNEFPRWLEKAREKAILAI